MSNADKKLRLRIIGIGCLLGMMFIATGARLVYLQGINNRVLSKIASSQHERNPKILGKRGGIFDVHNRKLAVSVDAYSIGADIKEIKNPKKTAASLAKILDVDRKNLYKKLTSKRRFVRIKQQVNPEKTAKIKALKIRGLTFSSDSCRYYPNKALAAQVLGFSGIDHKGLSGLEFSFNKTLKGKNETFKMIRDAHGHRFPAEDMDPPDNPGNNLVLTIDRNIQYITENALEKAVKKFRAASGIAVVMDPNTGAVLAMAHYPFFNPNTYNDYDNETWRNRSVTDPFEPGSTMKIFLAATALDSGLCSPETIFYCENGAYNIGRNTVNDTHPHEWLSLSDVIKFSSNIGAVKISEITGKEKLYSKLKAFGFGSKTNIECPGETSGLLAPSKKWTKIDTGAISFGQGLSVSAIQLTAAASAIANGGLLMEPHIVKSITGQDGKIITSFPPRVVRKTIKPKTAKLVREMMSHVVAEGGTGTNAAMENYEVCGKTGTAQKVDEHGRYAKRKYVASFLGFAPKKDPRLTVLVAIDEPREAYYGGTVAAPAFKSIMHETLSYLDMKLNKKTPLIATNDNGTDK